ncbi:hypothetical protein [Ktedonobacter robiniae]|uniref:Uncharacterized protein n=1 Tax=Ktedonobacter robiniae TaxID=2778365 RepID=A0ABQ3UY86_9CHLR|nr:hypothetical protein [Ktedonobacter robiniae]GHO57633.1 hypothetical protein KSB_61080 [Ktedonobacter robiniae]
MTLVTGATENIGSEVVNLPLSGGEEMIAVTYHPTNANIATVQLRLGYKRIQIEKEQMLSATSHRVSSPSGL